MAQAREGAGRAREADRHFPQLRHDRGARTKQRRRLARPTNRRSGKVQSGHEEADGRHRRSQRLVAGRAEKGAVVLLGPNRGDPTKVGESLLRSFKAYDAAIKEVAASRHAYFVSLLTFQGSNKAAVTLTRTEYI